MFFFKNHAENEAGRLVSGLSLFCFLKKLLYELKASGLQLSFFTWIAFNVAYNENRLYKTLDY